MLPELKTVHYQRREAVFATHDPKVFDWDTLLGRDAQGVQKWLHMTGITPMVSPACRASWCSALASAKKLGVPVSMDFNHRKQLGTLEDLWSVMSPVLSDLELIIFSVGSLVELAELEGVPHPTVPFDDPEWRRFMAATRSRWGVARLVLCFKTRDVTGLQRRWSALADEQGVHTTYNSPVYHRPKDECGGGSAWAAGFLDSLYFNGWARNAGDANKSTSDVFAGPIVDALRRADLLAAMCQETVGDHSQVIRAELSRIEQAHAGAPVDLDMALGAVSRVFPAPPEALETLQVLKGAGILAILRAKNADAAIKRGIELVELGCRAIEVTLDTTDWRRVIKTLADKLPAGVCVGVGTVMDETVSCLEEIKQLGGKFALSPIAPTGFIAECHRLGLLAVPSGLSSNELWDLRRQGAAMLKMFHAGQVTAKILKSMMGVSPLRAMNIMPSGGVSPSNAMDWLDAGATIVGMGSNLAGKDINYEFGTAEYAAAEANWAATGKAAAKTLFDTVHERS